MTVTNSTNIVAFIPARAGSKRMPGKNIRSLRGHPLIAYTIAAAVDSGVFDDVIVSTDSEKYADIARYYGAEVPFLRPPELSGSHSPDIEWVRHTFDSLSESGRHYDCFSILRPTNPFRQVETIQRAWKLFQEEFGIDSLRAVERCIQHPGKMWVVREKRMSALLPFLSNGHPWHSSQYQTLPVVYAQNASLEIAYARVAIEDRTIAGEVIIPFMTTNHEGFDINEPQDWVFAEYLIAQGMVTLPLIKQAPYSG